MESAALAELHYACQAKVRPWDSGWSHKTSTVTGKAVRIFQGGTKNLASDSRRETSVGSPQVAFVKHSGTSPSSLDTAENSSLGHSSIECKAG